LITILVFPFFFFGGVELVCDGNEFVDGVVLCAWRL